jgi:hypothetical protein
MRTEPEEVEVLGPDTRMRLPPYPIENNDYQNGFINYFITIFHDKLLF